MVLLGDQAFESPEDLEPALQDLQVPSRAEATYDFDIVHPSFSEQQNSQTVTAILYGTIGSPTFYKMHQLLVSAASKPAEYGGPSLCWNRRLKPGVEKTRVGSLGQLDTVDSSSYQSICNPEKIPLDFDLCCSKCF